LLFWYRNLHNYILKHTLAYVKNVGHNLNISCPLHVCNCRLTNSIAYTQYAGFITVCLFTTHYAVLQLPSLIT
jgi:hypothetical protein